MSSVGSSDSSNRQDEIVRRTREEYRKAEAEAAKKHKTELRRLTERHYQEIENLKQQHMRELENVKSGSADAISRRDHHYQQEIEDIRNMHRKQQQQHAEEIARREDALRNATRGDMDAQKNRNDQRIEKLSDDYQASLSERERIYQENMKAAREAQADAIKANRERLEKAHAVEKQSMRNERDQSLGNLQREYGKYRETSESRRKALEMQHRQEKNRASDNLMRTVANERARQADQADMLREGFNDGIDRMRERYENAAEKERQANSLSANMLKSTAAERIDNQVRRLETENATLKDTNTRNALKLKQDKEREVRNIKDAWGKNIENLQAQRDEAVRQSNETTAKDVAKVRDGLERQLFETNRQNQMKLGESDRIHRHAYDNLVGDFEARQEQTQSMADHRVKTVYANATEEKARLTEMQQQQHAASRRQHLDEMKALRQQMEDDKHQTVLRMQDQMRKQELQHTERMNLVVQKYEKTIQGMKDEMQRERKLNAENLKRTVDELQRAHKVSIDQLEAKNRERMREVNSRQAEELRQLNKRHDEKLDAVMVEVKKT